MQCLSITNFNVEKLKNGILSNTAQVYHGCLRKFLFRHLNTMNLKLLEIETTSSRETFFELSITTFSKIKDVCDKSFRF